MGDDVWSSTDDGKTEMLEVPDWLEKERAAKEQQAEEATSLIDTSDWQDLRQGSTGTGPRALSPGRSDGRSEERKEQKTNRYEAVQKPIPNPTPDLTAKGGAKLPLLDAERADTFPYERLQVVSTSQRQGLDAVAAILPGKISMGELEAKMADRMTALFGRSHQVRWSGLGTAMLEREELAADGGCCWTWGRVLPGHHRIAAGVDRPLQRAWVDGVVGDAEGPWHVGDDFESGLIAFLVAELCGVLTTELGWPPFCWAVNPIEAQTLVAIFAATEGPLLEVVFQVVVGEEVCGEGTRMTSGVLRMWLPIGVVRQVSESSAIPEDQSADLEARYGGLVVKRPLVAGRTLLRRGEFEGLRSGDVLMVERHGVESGDVRTSSSPGAARWMVGEKVAWTGTIRDSEDGCWQFVVAGDELITTNAEVRMTETQRDEEGEVEAISVEATKLELEVRIGAVEMELASMARLRPGQILDCDRPMGSPVDLVVAGTQVGRGELVSVDGKLGVRILAMSGR